MLSLLLILIKILLVDGKSPRTDVTVSGISSGGAMATQFHLAFSKEISGCGILAGPPYYCAGNGFTMGICMNGPSWYISSSAIEWSMNTFYLEGAIDDPSLVMNDSVYIFSGRSDTVVNPGIVKLNEEVYSRLGANIKTNFDMKATHCFPTENYGNECSILNEKSYINKCDFNMAYDMLNHLYGGYLINPSSSLKRSLNGHLLLFDQESFINPVFDENSLTQWIKKNLFLYESSNWNWSSSSILNIRLSDESSKDDEETRSIDLPLGFDKKGFIYFPSSCLNKKCSIHVALHGCKQGRSFVGDVFATKSGYLEVAETNDLIVVFPQIIESLILPTNPMGCWDWWGYSSIYYPTQNAPQVSSIKKIVDTIRIINHAFANLN